MAQTNYTPISLYYSTTASAVPTAANLVPGELAINTADGKLYYEDSAGVVQVLATKSTGSIGGSNTQVQFNNSGSLGGSSGLTWDGSFLTTSSIKNSALTASRVTFAGGSGLLTDSANFIWDNTNARLGIGTSPSFKLHISTTGNVSSQAYNVNTDTGTAVYTGYIASTDKNETALRSYGSGFTTFTHAGISLANFTELWAGVASSTGPAGMLLGVESASPIVFATNNTERMRIDTSGNLGLGVTPSAWSAFKAFEMSDGSYFSTYNFGGLYIGNNNYYNGSNFIYKNTGPASLYTQGAGTHAFSTVASGTAGNTITFSERMKIDSSGIVTMSAYGAGAATFSASGVISSVSDETWKTKDGVPTNTDAMLQKLEPGYWFYNEEKAPIFGEDRQLGFYAQNVHEAIGEEAAPTPQEGKPWGYYDRSVLAIAVMSLKNALNTIEELKQRIETLENK